MRKILLLVAITLACFSCKDKTLSFEEQMEVDILKINEYLAAKGLTNQVDSTASGLRYIITDQGDGGAKPVSNSVATVGYKGYFLDGEVFDETTGSAWAQFGVRQVVPGFGEALTLLSKKGKGTFFIPSGLGYGANSPSGIPANSVLIFEVHLVDFF